MKKLKFMCLALVFAAVVSVLCACGKTEWILTEENFFFTLNNVQMFPERYLNNVFELNCYTYLITDTEGNTYLCGVRHCSSGYGCTCGNDTIIGFLLDYDGEIPEPVNQSDKNSVEKTWIHIRGTIETAERVQIKVYAYTDGVADPSKPTETISIPTLSVSSLTVLSEEEYKDLKPYVVN